MKNAKLRWDKGTSGNMFQGDLVQASLTSDWVEVGGKPFSIELTNTAAGSPNGTWSFEISSDGGTTADVVDTSLAVPAITNPDGTTTPQHQTINFPAGTVVTHLVRVKYARTGGGSGDNVQGRIIRQ